jgi:Asp-tRNA(Asn)/Glu-tRNA(Gln) amidotransferase A subunit family amidase
MVPFALGTQTLGSVLRPASFCGVCGFKPSHGLLPVEGVMAFAPSLDTVGLFTQTAADMKELWARGFDGRFDAGLVRVARLRVSAAQPMQRALDAVVERVRAAGVPVDEIDAPQGWDQLLAAALTINQFQGARVNRERYQQFGERMGVKLAALIREGLAIPDEDYYAARAHLEKMRVEISSLFWDYPAIVTPAAAGAAPQGFGSTGDPALNAPWTALGVPAIAVPMPVDGAPLGLQLTGAWGRDDALVAVASELEALLG